MELTIQAIDKGIQHGGGRDPLSRTCAGLSSKLHTVRDGFRILRLLLFLFRDYKPFVFFTGLSCLILATGLTAGSLPVYEYFTTGMVGRFPLAILAAALCNLAAFTFLPVLLESSLRHRKEMFQIALRQFSIVKIIVK